MANSNSAVALSIVKIFRFMVVVFKGLKSKKGFFFFVNYTAVVRASRRMAAIMGFVSVWYSGELPEPLFDVVKMIFFLVIPGTCGKPGRKLSIINYQL
jgi:hypothetical protein